MPIKGLRQDYSRFEPSWQNVEKTFKISFLAESPPHPPQIDRIRFLVLIVTLKSLIRTKESLGELFGKVSTETTKLEKTILSLQVKFHEFERYATKDWREVF